MLFCIDHGLSAEQNELTAMESPRMDVAAVTIAAEPAGTASWPTSTTGYWAGWRWPEVADYIRMNWPSTHIPGIGRVNACQASNRTGHMGTMSMFEKLGSQ